MSLPFRDVLVEMIQFVSTTLVKCDMDISCLSPAFPCRNLLLTADQQGIPPATLPVYPDPISPRRPLNGSEDNTDCSR